MPRAAKRRRGEVDCRGCGCGQLNCSCCWPPELDDELGYDVQGLTVKGLRRSAAAIFNRLRRRDQHPQPLRQPLRPN
ncbi:Uu.00g015000.m01.CDS01 [Anthostomella pinea]|uniref:Uu.00g015000.m01.CDS01 n=1 Tax=Anthostomella pinea TaxID=933095 RepID=A0AAI8VYG2_9PEZI|nr:Uu.00g015000.m01.CDS01 [Anthostomella pinea]